ncbi:hypothetical protein CDD82_2206 [Ophiocordyceps australis]|uniref:Uncharacterized protein n=1 Tax=Ophiocordyceps australis TaxID=1399860 RepID=A0A2C5Y1X4_9HYPO|nr:hypothetical protein CDD82_2206 [Ophiocordyceps australis]
MRRPRRPAGSTRTWWRKTLPPSRPPGRERGVWAQRKLRADGDGEWRVSVGKVRRAEGIGIKHQDGSYAADMVTQLLRKSLDKPSDEAQATPWASQLVAMVLGMWESRRLRAVAVSYDGFARAGLSDMASVSQLDGDVLTVKVGLFGETELRSPAWHPLLATIAAEALLYHVARVQLGHSHAQAVRAEHLLADTAALSKRLEMELALADAASLRTVLRRTNAELMRHLCWDVDVDAEWEGMPADAREAVISRITGHAVAVTGGLVRWLSDHALDLATIDFGLRLSLDIFQNCEERYMSTVCYAQGGADHAAAPLAAQLRPVRLANWHASTSRVGRALSALATLPLSLFKWLLVISGGGTNVERELAFRLGGVPGGGLVLEAVLFVWQTCRAIKDLCVYTLLVYHRADLVHITRLAQKGERRKMKRNAMIVDLPRKTITAFASTSDHGGNVGHDGHDGDGDDGNGNDGNGHDGNDGLNATMTLKAYNGRLQSPPAAAQPPVFTASYDAQLRLVRRVDALNTTSTYKYFGKSSRWPQSKKVLGDKYHSIGFYDSHGRIKHGVLALAQSSTKVNFTYHYKATPRASASVLRADFAPINTGSTEKLSVYWGVPPSDYDYASTPACDWIPSTTTTAATP